MVSKSGRFSFGSAYAEADPGHIDVAAQDQAERELDRLHGELHALKATLGERETALATAALDAQQTRDQWQQELTARVAAAEAQWRRQQSATTALAELTARCETAEQTLEQLGQEQAQQDNSVDGGASAQHADGETGLDQAPSAIGATLGDTAQKSKIVIRTNRVWAAEAVEETRHASRKHATGGIFAAAALGMLAIAALVTDGGNPVRRGSSQDLLVSLRDVNVRAGPSAEAKVVSMLPRGVKVAMIEQRGSWNLVEIEGAGRNTRPRQGWVYASFLKRETGPR